MAKALSPSAIEVTWQPPPEGERNGVIRAYYITVAEQETRQTTELVRNGSELSIRVDSLHPYYTYGCSVAAATAIGVGPEGHATVRTHESGGHVCMNWA